jgi:hypothetical protein
MSSSSTHHVHGGPLGSSPDGAEPVRVRPFGAIEPLPRPRTASGLLPAAEVRPVPPMGRALRLRRAVALFVVLGTLCLVAYVASQRVAHGREPATPRALARP